MDHQYLSIDFLKYKFETNIMELNFDYWQGESIEEVIQSIAEFRKQVLVNSDQIQTQSLSTEINFLQHYFDSESTIIVANDCGFIVGYVSLVTQLENHPLLTEYSYYGPDLVVTEGPIIHQDYRRQGIAKSLIMESIHSCQNRDVELLIFDPTSISNSDDTDALNSLATQFNFYDIGDGTNRLFKKEIESIS